MDNEIEITKLNGKMEYYIHSIPRESFCWLDEMSVVVISVADNFRHGTSAIVNLVTNRSIDHTYLNAFQISGTRKLEKSENFICSACKM